MRVLFLGVGTPIPSFIRNRILQLDITGQIKPVVLAPLDAIEGFRLGNGQVLPQIPVSFSFRQTIIPLLRFSISCPVSTLRLWQSLAIYPLRVRIRTFIKCHSLVRIRNIDVVHFQWIVSSDEINWTRMFFKVPVIISARGSQLTVYPATEHGYENKIRESLVAADYIHSVSQSMSEASIRFGANPHKVFVNYNGIDIEKFNRTFNKKKSDETLHLISTGALMWRKGYLWQLLLVKELQDAGMKVNLKIIGDGFDRQELHYAKLKLGLQDAVNMDGQKPTEEVIESLQSSDIYISTSAAEGLSNAVLEAVACGLPVVAFECEGMNEVITNGQNGYIVPFGDLKAMEGGIRNLNNDRKLLESMGCEGALIAAEKFDYRIHIQKMVEFYKSVTSENE